ncbi:autotransporter domain-containing protein [Sphingomonas sp. XMGL2]|uniref:Autotransporter domain-containing protein n=1 Tax=Sphingomonas quercus TaxID=2842451 RepID=A0ABS6BKN5_9SPHN|nr:autotransporter domain-containing protein [Sphingomonas quercus]
MGGAGGNLIGDVTIDNAGSITGGAGGSMADGGDGIGSGGKGTTPSDGAAGGNGGMITGSITITNSGTIQGGNGGGTPTGTPLYGGTGGAGVRGANVTIINSGTIAGGMGATGQAAAITFTGGENSLELRSGSIIKGGVSAGGSADTLILGGTGYGFIDNISTFVGFEKFEKNSDSYWTFTGTIASATPWIVNGGTLAVNATLDNAGSSVTVNSGGTLTGKGKIGNGSGGLVTVNSGGTLAGVEGDTLSMYSLTLADGAIISATLNQPGTTGAPSGALFQVAGDLSLNGTATVKVTGSTDFGYGNGLYGLIAYGGALSGDGKLTAVEVGGSGDHMLAIDTQTAGQFNLLVMDGVPATGPFIFWKPGATLGGAGTWTPNGTLWGNVDGKGASTFDGGTDNPAIFAGTTGGTVTVSNGGQDIALPGGGLQFATTGYTITGDPLSLTNQQTKIWVGNGTDASAGMTATIASKLVNGEVGDSEIDGGINKVDVGKLILTGTNFYTGATTISGGTLALSGSGSIAESSGVTVKAETVFDISGTNSGASIKSLAGAGIVALGGKTLTITDAGGDFAGALSGTGGVTLTGGMQTLTGTNSYTGATTISGGSWLNLSGAGSIAQSSGVTANGGLDISGTTGGATIGGLSGTGAVVLDDKTLTVDSDGNWTFDGYMTGNGGGLTKSGAGTLTLTDMNTYTGPTIIYGGTLALGATGKTGTIEDSSGVELAAAGTTLLLDSEMTKVNIKSLSGVAGSVVDVGVHNLTITNANGEFAGDIKGAALDIGSGLYIFGGLTLAGGTLTLSGANTYARTTAVTGGTLLVNGSINGIEVNGEMESGDVDVYGGATLGGSGSVAGDVDVDVGGAIKGATGQTLAIGGYLSLNGATVNVALGAPSETALFDVAGDVYVYGDTKIAVTAGQSFGAGLYRLVDYDGAFAPKKGGTLTADTLAGYDLGIQTSIEGQINLTVAKASGGSSGGGGTSPTPPAGPFNFWNPVPGEAGTITGGAGVWTSATLWSNAGGTATAALDASTAPAIFAAAPGVVRVEGAAPVPATGLQFAVHGYEVTGDALVLTDAQTPIRVGDGTAAGAAYVATLSAPITGTGGLVKTDLGTLILSGANDYTGGTTIAGGILEVTGDASLGAAGEDVILDGGRLVVPDGFTTTRAINSIGGGTFDVAGGETLGVDSGLGGGGLFVKTGGGLLAYDGDGSGFDGLLRVDDGKLVVGSSSGRKGARVGGSFEVARGGTLGGHGTIGSGKGSLVTIAAGGTLAPGNSIGTLTVDGDLSFDAGSVLEVEVDPAGVASDLVHVTGTAALAGSVRHIGENGAYGLGATYTILTADGGVSGRFAGVASNYAFLTPTLGYDANNVTLTLARNAVAFAAAADTRNQRAAAGALDSIGFAAGHPVYDAVALLADDARVIRGAYDALSGEVHASARTALIEDSRFVRDAAVERLRAGDGRAIWGRAFGAWARTASDGNAARLTHSTGGLLLGADTDVGGARVGVVGGYGRTSFTVAGRASSGDADSYHLGAYAGGEWGGFALRGGLAHAWQKLDTKRAVAFPGLNETPRADYKAGTTQVFGDVGYKLGAFEPFASLAYVSLRTKGFTEQGGAAAVKAGSQTTDATFSTLGLRAAGGFDLGGMQATARGALGWRHAFGEVVPVSVQSFTAGDAFTVAGVPITRNAATVEAGLDFALSPSATLGLSYQGQMASGASQHSGRVGLAVRF